MRAIVSVGPPAEYGTTMTGTPGEIVIFVGVITAIQAAINHLGIKLTALLTDWSGYIIFGTTIALILALLAYAPTHEWSRLWTFTNFSGDAGGGVWPQNDSLIYLFLLSLLLPIYTITGYDASAHTSEETYRAAHSVPRGIVDSVLWSALFGWAMVAAIVIAIPDLAEGAKQGWNVFFNTMTTIMPNWLVQLLYLFIFIAQFLCGLATVTSASRMIYAFSRDGGLPLVSNWVSKVSPRFRTPVAAIWTGAVLEFLYVWMAQTVSIGGTNIYTIVVNSTLIFLFLSFTVPIALGFFAIGTEKWPVMGPWDIGIPMYRLFAVLSVLCMGLIIYIAVQPPNDKVLWITLVFLVITAIVWFLFENTSMFFIGSYLTGIFETPASFQPVWWVIGYIIFVGLNARGVELSFTVTVLVTLLAIAILLIFFVSAIPLIDFGKYAMNIGADPATGAAVELPEGNGPFLPFGIHVLQRDRSVEARGRCRCHLAPVNAHRVRQSAARNAVPDLQSIGWARLARARLGLSGRERRCLGQLYGFHVDRAPARNHGSRRRLQEGIGGDHLDYLDRSVAI